MPTYTLKCEKCGARDETEVTIAVWTEIRDNLFCPYCPGGKMFHQILGKNDFFAREAFPRGDWEHLAFENTVVRDAVHLKDICQERGLYSKLLEDGK